jgi:hypothetical protein
LPESDDQLPGFIFTVNNEMLEYLKTIKDKYRIYIFVNLAPLILKWQSTNTDNDDKVQAIQL